MPCWSSHERHWSVAWFVLRKGGGIVVAFVLVHLLSQCHVVCAGRLFQHGGARHCLFMRMSGGIVPLTTGSMKVGVDRMHPDTSRSLLFRAASSRCVWAVVLHREYRINVLYTLFVKSSVVCGKLRQPRGWLYRYHIYTGMDTTCLYNQLLAGYL